ncbi:solute carrier family 25 member 35-like [Daphnia pulex]|uniref:solute carrier family 25 member 35-like n=1 Tax=Daphnia pulex TaxID=6669 RepID=UPI001EDEAB59|nr:solute carrier family 25 member 35-like [Daphnia pulex]XP_046453386.1 solute carrier family 25 member 35-like [Daphnia pulex]
MEYAFGGLAACGACLFTNPLDVVKTRMQLQGELLSRGAYSVLYKNSLHAFYVVAKNDGIKGLQKGLVPALWYQMTMNGTRLGLYHFMENRGWTHSHGSVSSVFSIAAGAVSGALGAFTASPFYLIKTQLQSQSSQTIAVGCQHNHTGFLSAIQKLYYSGGITGLWRGVTASMMRTGVGSAAQLSTFTKSRETINNLNILPHNSWKSTLAAAMLSGVAVAVAMTPFDVISTRLYNQTLDRYGKGVYYSGPFDCLIKVFKAEGFFGLYKGCLANYLRVGPHSVLTLTIWTFLRETKFEGST